MARRPRKGRLPPFIKLPPFHRRHRAGIVIVIALVVVGVLGRRSPPPAPPTSDWTRYHGKVFDVVKVVDGDTLDIDAPDGRFPDTRIRLWGVDTPEVATAPTGEMYWGNEASRFAKQTLSGRRVRIELVESDTRGKYHRLLAYVYLDESGALFNELLLTHGHAYADTRFRHPKRERFIELENTARQLGVGLWAEVTTSQMPGWRQRREKGR